MREIKFRAWCRDRKEMGYFNLFDNDEDLILTEDFSQLTYADKCEVMQYTGLKDKNGREIYEGDVLRGREYSSDKEPYNVLVKFELFSDGDSFACAGYDFHLDSEYNFTETGIIDCEVIGNIYEQPELKESTN